MNKQEYVKMFELEDSHFWFLGKRFFVDVSLNKYRSKIKTILDIGSGTGGMTKHLTKFGSVVGLEKNNLAIKLSKTRNIKIVGGEADNLKFPNAKFDLVTIFDVLYHKNIKDERKVIKETYRVLKTNGLLLITDSAHNFLQSSHDIETQGKARYSLQEMVNLVESNKFEIIKASYIFFGLFPIVALKRLVTDKILGKSGSDVAPVSPLINQILICYLKLESFLFHFIDFPTGTSVFVLARKK